MEVAFPDIPLYQGWGAPLRIESDIRDLELVHGAAPPELTGTLYRCGPDRQYPPMTRDDVFIDGEGMAHLFRFDDGHVDYRSRWVRTERFLLQEKARRSLFGRYRNRYTNDPSVAGKNPGTANTNIVWHGRKLLVLKEDSLPVEVDPDTLKARGCTWTCACIAATASTSSPATTARRSYPRRRNSRASRSIWRARTTVTTPNCSCPIPARCPLAILSTSASLIVTVT